MPGASRMSFNGSHLHEKQIKCLYLHASIDWFLHGCGVHLLITWVRCTCRTRFWWDLTAWIPWDYLLLLVLGDFHAGSSIVARVPLLRLLRLVMRLLLTEALYCTPPLLC